MKKLLFKIGLGSVGLFFLLLVVGALFPLSGNRFRNGAKRASTRNEIKMMTWILDDYIKSNDHLPVGGNAAIISALSAIYTTGKCLSKSKSSAQRISFFVRLALIKNLATRTTSFSTASQTIL
jgi:hypothetical protein